MTILKGPRWRLWLLVGLLLRLAAMPMAYHGDLYSVYWRAHLLADHGSLPEHNQVLSHLIHAGVLTLYKPFWPGLQKVWVHPFSYEDSGVPFLGQPAFGLLLFLLKLPYLAFDVVCLALLARLLKGHARRTSALVFWALNPVLLYSVYLYGRYETIPIFFVLWSLLLAQRGRHGWSVAVLSASLAVRLYTALLIPFYLILLGRGWRQRLRLAGITLLPVGGVVAAQAIRATSGQSFLAHSELLSFLSMPHRVFLFAAKIPILQMDSIQLWPFLMTLLILAAQFWGSRGYDGLWRYGLASHLLLFSLVLFHPQWFAWTMPFLALLVAERRELVWLHMVQVVALAVYACQFGWEVTTGLFTPILGWQRAVAVSSPLDLLEQFGLGGVFVGFWRSVLTAVNVWVMGMVLAPGLRSRLGGSAPQPREPGAG
jgi:hypothetical protein